VCGDGSVSGAKAAASANKGISSPASTGGAGSHFEHHVAAFWLAQLLVNGIPPVLVNSRVAQVHFQTERLGWHTDDFLIECVGLATAKLAGQVKRGFTVSAADEECSKAIGDFWHDFMAGDPFNPLHDRFVLVTQRGTNTFLEHFAALLDCARAARDAAEFETRLGTKGLVSQTAVRYCGEVRQIIGAKEARSVSAADLWPFLRLLYLLSLDLHTATRQTEAHIKSLLAYAVKIGDPLPGAQASWSSLLDVASTGMELGLSLRRDDLPGELKQRHNSITNDEERILQAAKDHSEFVFRGIRAELGNARFQLCRMALSQTILTALEDSPVVIISGPAGSGKSAVAKQVINSLANDNFTFGFRAEEFAHPHLDGTLSAAQIPANAKALNAILATQSRIVILVESIERLLEKPTRDAFADLLELAAKNSAIRLILTCRDYSIDLVRASFLRGIGHNVTKVPPLSDAELLDVEAAFPILAQPLKSSPLRTILRNPYFLDKALNISWSSERPLPENERAFRVLFWQQIIRAEYRLTAGVARSREQIFQEIAVRRARALSPQVLCNDLDPDVLAGLRSDGLISPPHESPLLAAPAHDVLEDWAILHWIDEQNLVTGGTFAGVAAAIGPYPAVRRSYRRWVAELIERDAVAADGLFESAVTGTRMSAQCRDDTLVSFLKAPGAPEFLARHKGQLLANDMGLFKRVVHLLRVACTVAPDWLPNGGGSEVTFGVPDGLAWSTVLKLARDHVTSFKPTERLFLLGLVEDSTRGISWWAPDMEGAADVAEIAHSLLAGFDNYQSEKALKRTLDVIANIPKGDPDRFAALLRGSSRQTDGRRDRISSDFRKIIFAGMQGLPAARDLPDLVIEVGLNCILAPEGADGNAFYAASVGVERYFGVQEGRSFDSFPASGARGPWLQLFRHHPTKAINFALRVFNQSARVYARGGFHSPLEPAREVRLNFSDGTTCQHWCNPRLWNLYRGVSVGPYVLQSILMAMETWLLSYAKTYPQRLDPVLVDILRRSESACLSAVLASVATAYPQHSGEALLVFLGAPDYLQLDLWRCSSESQAAALSSIASFGRDAENSVYNQERKAANSLPHRKENLEDAIRKLQFGPLAPRVHEVLDRHKASIRPLDQQDDSDRTWRLALHRMDIRQTTISEVVEERDGPNGADESTAEPPRRYLRFDPMEPDPDVKEMSDQSVQRRRALNERLSIVHWGRCNFDRSNPDSHDPNMWRDFLSGAMNFEGDRDDELAMSWRGGPGIVAAVCVRDHWDELSAVEREWCVDCICHEVMASANQWNPMERVQRFDLSADRSCAWILSLIVTKLQSGPQRSSVEDAFAAAVTHPVNEVRWYAVWGISQNLSATDRQLRILCVNALAMEATLIEAEQQVPFPQRRDISGVAAESGLTVRAAFWKDSGIVPNAYECLCVDTWYRADANAHILAILSGDPEDILAGTAFKRAAEILVAWWNARDHDHVDRGEEPNEQAALSISDLLEKFVMRTSFEVAKDVLSPILAAIGEHPREASWILQALTAIEDSTPNTLHYWRLWQLFADGLTQAEWISGLDDEHPWGADMISRIFLTSYWKDSTRHWKSLEGHAHKIHALFESLPSSWMVFDRYIRFLYHIGEKSLPDAFVRVSKALNVGAEAMLADSNTVFLVVVLLQRHVYAKPLELKRDPRVREAVLNLLDILVENGSAAAFRMRDDFVTPVAI
jgi:hypothetical protein